MTIKKIYILLLIILCSANFSANGQEKREQVNRILFIFDASQSMLARWQSGRKIDIAKKLLSNMVDSLKNIENLEIGLRIYGHQHGYPPQVCDDTELAIPFCPANIAADRIKGKLSMIRAKGTTPIAKSLEEGAKDFDSYDTRNIVILITDGKEECDMDPCAISRLYQREGVILKPFIIGVGLDEEWKKSFDCVGRFFDANREKDFKNILNIVISHVIDNTTAEVRLLDENGNVSETNIPITFYDDFTGVAKYNFIHTMNVYGNPDTMVIDPVLSYKVVAHTIPPVIKKDVNIIPGKHTPITLETPQGEFKFKMNTKQDYQFIIRIAGTDSTLNIQDINTVEKYLVGKYDIELLTLPRKYFYDVEILQSTEVILGLDSPGSANIVLPSRGFGGIYTYNADKLEKIYTFNADKTQYKVHLLPGNYKVVYRAESAKEYIYSKEKNIKIKAGKSETIKFY